MKLGNSLQKLLKSFKLNKLMNSIKKQPLIVILVIVLGYFIFVKLSNCRSVEGFESKPSTFNTDVSKGKKLVWFYADWCGHCKSMKEEWDNASNEVDGKMVKINLGNSEDSKTEEISKKYEIQSFPTILLLENGEKKNDYEGERKTADFVKFVNQNC